MLPLPRGRPPKIKKLKNKNIGTSSIDIYGNYKLISTKFSETSLLRREY